MYTERLIPMNNVKHLSERLASYLYKLEDIKHVYSGHSLCQQETSLYTMMLIKEAAGNLVIDGRSYPLHRQKVFILSPNAVVHLHILSDSPVEFYRIRFHAQQAADERHFMPAELNCPDEFIVTHFHFLSDMVVEMDKKMRSGNIWDAMKANIIFQEMLCSLFKDAIHAPKPNVDQAITLTLDYMEQNYRSSPSPLY